jgi:hypothetical protein
MNTALGLCLASFQCFLGLKEITREHGKHEFLDYVPLANRRQVRTVNLGNVNYCTLVCTLRAYHVCFLVLHSQSRQRVGALTLCNPPCLESRHVLKNFIPGLSK